MAATVTRLKNIAKLDAIHCAAYYSNFCAQSYTKIDSWESQSKLFDIDSIGISSRFLENDTF